MKKVARYIIMWWYSHDLDQLDDILGNWKPGFIFTRLKFEVATKILAIIGIIKGISFRHEPHEFITWALNCSKEAC